MDRFVLLCLVVCASKEQFSRTSIEEVRESWVVFKTSDVTGQVCPVALEGDPQRSLDVSRAIGKARRVSEVCVGIDLRAAGLRRRGTASHCRVKAGEAVAVEDIEELHAEVGVDPFGEHGDGLGDVEVLALVEEFADAKGFGRVAKCEVGGWSKGGLVQEAALAPDKLPVKRVNGLS